MFCVSPLTRFLAARLMLLSLIVFPSFAGCKPRMQPPDTIALPDGTYQVHIDTSKPLRFHEYNFGSYCFDTYDCKVVLGRRADTDDEGREEKTDSSASYGDRYPDFMRGGWIDPPFPPPPIYVSWRDKDRSSHEAVLNLDEIFPGRVILHKVPQQQLPPVIEAPIIPEIVVEVNDRTVRVWMRAMIFTTVREQPDNPYSTMRNELMLAFEKTY